MCVCCVLEKYVRRLVVEFYYLILVSKNLIFILTLIL